MFMSAKFAKTCFDKIIQQGAATPPGKLRQGPARQSKAQSTIAPAPLLLPGN